MGKKIQYNSLRTIECLNGRVKCRQLAVSYDKLGMISLAEECNESAAKLKPDSAVKYNRQYFQSVRSENNKVP